MKTIVIIALSVAVAVYALYYYLNKSSGILKPILPTVFFEPPGDTNAITIDFGACPPGRGEVSGDFGSIKVEVWSLDINTCLMNYSSLAEGGKPWTRCLVPKNLGNKTFIKTYKGVDFSEISKYCKLD